MNYSYYIRNYDHLFQIPPLQDPASSSDEESAVKSYDIIVSRAGRNSDSKLERPGKNFNSSTIFSFFLEV